MCGKEEEDDREAGPDDSDAPAYYGTSFPIMPLFYFWSFQVCWDLFPRRSAWIQPLAMLVSTAFAIVIDGIRKADLQESFDSLKVFWSGMANIFKSVVTFIIAADIFSKGLIGLGFIDGLLGGQREGLGSGSVGHRRGDHRSHLCRLHVDGKRQRLHFSHLALGSKRR